MIAILDNLSFNKKELDEDAIKNILTNIYAQFKNQSYYDLYQVKHPMTQDDKDQLKKNYHKLSLKIHPDKTQGKSYQKISNELFVLIDKGFHTLTNKDAEIEYYLSQTPKQPEKHPPAFFNTGPKSTVTTSVHVHRVHHSNADDSQYKIFQSRFFAHPTRRFEGDIKKGKRIVEHQHDIEIRGDIYGHIETVSGNITIYGNVHGTVKSLAGSITINGSVKPNGVVSTVSNNIIITGRIDGQAESTFCVVNQP